MHNQKYNGVLRGLVLITTLKSKRCQVYGNRIERNHNGIILGKYCEGNDVHSNFLMDIRKNYTGVLMDSSDPLQVHDNFTVSMQDTETVDVS